MAHFPLKVAGFCQLPSGENYKNRKTGEEERIVFLHLFYIRNLSDSPIFIVAIQRRQMSFRLQLIRKRHIGPELQDHYMLDGTAEENRSNIVRQSHLIEDPF